MIDSAEPSSSLVFYLITISQAPVILWLAWFYFRDKNEKEPLGLLFKCFAGGALMLWPCIWLETNAKSLISSFELPRYLDTAIWGFLGIALIEEFVKFFVFMLVAWRSKEFNEPYDGIMYAVAASLGFAAIENWLYVFNHGAVVGWMRMFSAIPLHAMTGVLMGFYAGMARFQVDVKRKRQLLLVALATPVLLHGFYDYFLLVEEWLVVPLSYLLLLYQINLGRRAVRIHREFPLAHDEKLCLLVAPEHSSLFKDRLTWATLPLNLLGSLALSWAGIFIYVNSVDGEATWSVLRGSFYAAIVVGAVLLTLAYRLRKGGKTAQKLSFGTFILLLPTPAFPFGLCGIYGLRGVARRPTL